MNFFALLLTIFFLIIPYESYDFSFFFKKVIRSSEYYDFSQSLLISCVT